jgi:hypothetical protein
MRTSGVSADEIKCRKAKKMTRFDPVAKSSANKNIISIGSYRNCSQSYINIPPPPGTRDGALPGSRSAALTLWSVQPWVPVSAKKSATTTTSD